MSVPAESARFRGELNVKIEAKAGPTKLIARYDRNGDGVVNIRRGSSEVQEMAASAYRLLRDADRNHNGKVGARELRRLERAAR